MYKEVKERPIIKQVNPFYKSRRWLIARETILRRDGYMCQESKRYGKTREATTVHHIFPLDSYPEYAFETWNLISLCADAHDAMHDRKTGRLSDLGMDLLRRTARREKIKIPEKFFE